MNSYHRIEDEESNTNNNILAAVTNKFKDYMFDKEDQEQPLLAQTKYKKPVFMVDHMTQTYINMRRSFDYVGDNSTFQKRITTILVVQWVAFSFMVSSMAYFFRSPNFQCRIPLTDIYISCSSTVACPLIDTDYVKLGSDPISISQDFGLYCDHTKFAAFAQSMFFFGGFLSGYLFGYLSQRLGRRPILLLIQLLAVVSMVLCALAPFMQAFTISYFLIGFTLFGYETSVYSYIGEISAIRFRTISINMLTMVWAGTPIFLPFLSFIPSWRYAFILFAGLFFVTIPFSYKCFLESPRFLLSKKCYGQAKEIFKQISITNQRPPYQFQLIEEIEEENQTYLTFKLAKKGSMENILIRKIFDEETKTYNFLDLFRYPSLRKPTLVIMYWWMFRFFMYFGLNLALESMLKSGVLLTLIISGAAVVQILGTFGIPIMTTLLYNKYKLDIMRIALLATTTACVVMWFVEIDTDCKLALRLEDEFCFELILMIALVVILKFFNTVFFSGLILYYSQVFPTPVRSLGCGFTLTFGRLGTIIVPFYINYMKLKYEDKNSLCFLAPFGLLAYFLSCMMPYTEKEGMQEQIKEDVGIQGYQLVNL